MVKTVIPLRIVAPGYPGSAWQKWLDRISLRPFEHDGEKMRGTDYRSPRCAALTGKLGEKVACAIYEWRPSPCREFAAGSDACDRARMRHGLAPYCAFPSWPQAA